MREHLTGVVIWPEGCQELFSAEVNLSAEIRRVGSNKLGEWEE